ncbi:MAG: hypothetical protein ABGZ17_25830, partial [Planctomycetaceae bacterium]
LSVRGLTAFGPSDTIHVRVGFRPGYWLTLVVSTGVVTAAEPSVGAQLLCRSNTFGHHGVDRVVTAIKHGQIACLLWTAWKSFRRFLCYSACIRSSFNVTGPECFRII